MKDVLHTVESDEHNRYTWGERCLGWRLLELAHMQVRQEWMPVGGSETPHWHARAHQFFYVLKGQLQVRVPGQDLLLQSQQGMHIPAGVGHVAANGGSDEVHFLVFSSPGTQGDRTECARSPSLIAVRDVS